ncbi:MAG TPA: hypothetical protein VFM18_17405 [Methanosarcina sp.]|nr:hypothetical protein [Methanosarcina sp.]
MKRIKAIHKELDANWFPVKIPLSSIKRHLPNIRPTEAISLIVNWCNENHSTGSYYTLAGYFYFETEGDAALFALRWT